MSWDANSEQVVWRGLPDYLLRHVEEYSIDLQREQPEECLRKALLTHKMELLNTQKLRVGSRFLSNDDIMGELEQVSGILDQNPAQFYKVIN